MNVTFFFDHAASDKSERNLSPNELAELIRSTTAPSKDQLPWLKLARFGEYRKHNGNGKLGSLRNNKNVSAISGIEGDYEVAKSGSTRRSKLSKRQASRRSSTPRRCTHRKSRDGGFFAPFRPSFPPAAVTI